MKSSCQNLRKNINYKKFTPKNSKNNKKICFIFYFCLTFIKFHSENTT